MKRLLLFLAFAASCFAAGTVQQTVTQLGNSDTWALTYRWTGDSVNGSVPVTPGKDLASCCQGYVVTAVQIVPGSPNPTALYSVTLPDGSGIDILGGAATSLSATVPSSFTPSGATVPLQGTVSLTITGQMTAGAKGVVTVFLVKPSAFTIAQPAGANNINWITQVSNKPFVDVRSCGAKGDGVTDDRAAIQACLQAAGAGMLYFPAGTYRLTSGPLRILNSNVTFQGIGNGSILLNHGVNTDTLDIGDGTNRVSGAIIRDLALATDNSSPSTSGFSINVNYASNLLIDNVSMAGSKMLWGALNFSQCQFCQVSNSSGMVSYLGHLITLTGVDGSAHSTSSVFILNNELNTVALDAITIGDFTSGIYIYDNSIFSILNGYAVKSVATIFGADCCIFLKRNDIDISSVNCNSSWGAGQDCDAGVADLTNVGFVQIQDNSMGGTSTTTTKNLISTDITVGDINVLNNQINAFAINGVFLQGGGVVAGNVIRGNNSASTLISLENGGPYDIASNTLRDSTNTGIFLAHQVNAQVNMFGNSFLNVAAQINFDTGFNGLLASISPGCPDSIPPIAAAASIVIAPCVTQATITGTTPISSITPIYNGRHLALQFTNASPGGVTTGGANPGAVAFATSVTQNHRLSCDYFGSNWVCQ